MQKEDKVQTEGIDAIKASLGPLPGRLFTVEEAAAYTGLSVSYFKNYRSRKKLGLLKPVKIGRMIRYRLQDIDAWTAGLIES